MHGTLTNTITLFLVLASILTALAFGPASAQDHVQEQARLAVDPQLLKLSTLVG